MNRRHVVVASSGDPCPRETETMKDGELLEYLIDAANKSDPIDLADTETSRWLRDLDVPFVAVLWCRANNPNDVRHYFVKTSVLVGDEVRAAAFWLTNLPDHGFRFIDTPNGPSLEALEARQRPDGKLEVIGPTECADCRMKTGIRGEWYLVHDHVWRQAWPGDENWLANADHQFFCEEILCVGCLERRLCRQLTPDDFPRGWDDVPTFMSKRLRNRAYGS